MDAKDARAWAMGRWARFRAESPYFQAKVGLAAGYALIVLLTIVLAPPRGVNWTSVQERIPFGLAFKTALIMTNQRNGTLSNVTIEVRGTGIEFDGKKVPGTWHTMPFDMAEGVPTKILTEQLFDAQGANPPYSLLIDDARVLDHKGRTLVDVRPTEKGAPAQ